MGITTIPKGWKCPKTTRDRVAAEDSSPSGAVSKCMRQHPFCVQIPIYRCVISVHCRGRRLDAPHEMLRIRQNATLNVIFYRRVVVGADPYNQYRTNRKIGMIQGIFVLVSPIFM